MVGEDHPRGELAFAGLVRETLGTGSTGSVDHYQRAPLPTRLSSRQRGALVAEAARAAQADLVVCFTSSHDSATPWDLPAIRAALEAAALPLLEVGPDGFAPL